MDGVLCTSRICPESVPSSDRLNVLGEMNYCHAIALPGFSCWLTFCCSAEQRSVHLRRSLSPPQRALLNAPAVGPIPAVGKWPNSDAARASDGGHDYSHAN